MKQLLISLIPFFLISCEGEWKLLPNKAIEDDIHSFLFYKGKEKITDIEGGGFTWLGQSYYIKFKSTEKFQEELTKNKFINCKYEKVKDQFKEINDPDFKKLFKTKWYIHDKGFKYYIYDQGPDVQKQTVIAVKNNIFYLVYFSAT